MKYVFLSVISDADFRVGARRDDGLAAQRTGLRPDTGCGADESERDRA